MTRSNNFNSFQAKIFIASILFISVGTFLPWVIMPNYTVLGRQTAAGPIIILLLVISLYVFFFVKNKEKFVSIIYGLIGLLCLLIALYAFSAYRVIESDAMVGIFVNYGPGLYVVLIGSIGLMISGIIGLREKVK